MKILRQLISLPQVVERADAVSGESLSAFAHEDHFGFRQKPVLFVVPLGLKIEIARQIRGTQIRDETGDRRVLAVSLFLVNRRSPLPEPEFEDEAMAFQAEVEVEGF